MIYNLQVTLNKNTQFYSKAGPVYRQYMQHETKTANIYDSSVVEYKIVVELNIPHPFSSNQYKFVIESRTYVIDNMFYNINCYNTLFTNIQQVWPSHTTKQTKTV